MNARPLDQNLVNWFRDGFRQACDVLALLEKARQAGYTEAAIASAAVSALPRGTAFVNGRIADPPLVRRAPPTLRNLGAPGFDLYALDDFMAPRDCEQLIVLVSHYLQPSPLSHDNGDPEFRVSRSAMLCFLNSPLATEIDAKICRTLGVSAEYSEGIQAQRYDVGGQFKPHFDFFGPGSDPHRSACSVRGNRTWTFMVYLNDGMDGGATRFTEIDRVVRPKTGMALFWNNLSADGAPNPLSRHCGEPVTGGHKVIITKWFRMLGDGPLFLEPVSAG
jgi:prolyl 4-hydroxylase